MSRSNNRKVEPQVLVPDEPFEFDLRVDGEGSAEATGDQRLLMAIFQSLGAASVCWTQKSSGVFMAERAEQIGMALKREFDLAISEAYSDGYDAATENLR